MIKQTDYATTLFAVKFVLWENVHKRCHGQIKQLNAVCPLAAISLKVTASATPNIQATSLCLLPPRTTCAVHVRSCVCVSATRPQSSSPPSYASLVFPQLPPLLSSGAFRMPISEDHPAQPAQLAH